MSAPGIFRPPAPTNEPVKDYAPGSPEREQVRRRLDQLQAERIELPLVIGVLGGLFPAIRAGRMPVSQALSEQ